MRGEDRLRLFTSRPQVGSPPHARGRHGDELVWRDLGPDHPRMRGEDFLRNDPCQSPRGSPPHARGRRMRHPSSDSGRRITPACAGKTEPVCLGLPRVRDHPRMRGEDSHLRPNSLPIHGSPPHARGRPFDETLVLGERRITPACAGKTGVRPDKHHRWTDHPRMRGEDHPGGTVTSPAKGSPPHARGRLLSVCFGSWLSRITPACAGKTAGASSPQARTTDHPRMRGEDISR